MERPRHDGLPTLIANTSEIVVATRASPGGHIGGLTAIPLPSPAGSWPGGDR
jgi:hypothetical protein